MAEERPPRGKRELHQRRNGHKRREQRQAAGRHRRRRHANEGASARRDERALDTRVDYGLQLPAGGLLIPFGIYGQSQYGRRLQVGLLLSRLGPVGLEVSGERYALLDPGHDEYRMSALGSITFGGADKSLPSRSAVK